VNTLIDIHFRNLHKNDCVLSVSNNTSTLGYLYHSHVFSLNPVMETLSHQIGKLIIHNKLVLYSQHLKEEFNTVLDLLSRDFYIPTQFLTHIFRNLCLTQMPDILKIYPVPAEIKSFICSTIALSNKQQPTKKHQCKVQ